MKSQQNSSNQIFNQNAFFFFLLTGATWYYLTIYIVFTYFASYTGCEDDIFEVISNLNIQGSTFSQKKWQHFAENKKSELWWVQGVCFFQVWAKASTCFKGKGLFTKYVSNRRGWGEKVWQILTFFGTLLPMGPIQ